MTDCKKTVHGSNAFHMHTCSRKAVKDGYCKQHHPDSAKARAEESKRKRDEKQAKHPLVIARKTICELKDLLIESFIILDCGTAEENEAIKIKIKQKLRGEL